MTLIRRLLGHCSKSSHVWKTAIIASTASSDMSPGDLGGMPDCPTPVHHGKERITSRTACRSSGAKHP
eukprot:3131948-Pyramimonas_sp.AAC.1